jgi:hypothetical protein
MNKVNDADKADIYMCSPFKDNCIEPDYDSSMEFFIGITYSVVPCALFWIGILYLIKSL